MKKFTVILILLISSVLFAQKNTQSTSDKNNFPVQTMKSDRFKLSHISFNKLIPDARGEILEVEFRLYNTTEESQNLYIFAIATYETFFKTTSSFQSPSLDDTDPIKFFVPFPDNLKNFEYTVKDKAGKDKIKYIKYPKNIKDGVNPITQKPYFLDEVMTFRSQHLTRHFRKFKFFNEITILIFDEQENLLYRQLYKLKGQKR